MTVHDTLPYPASEHATPTLTNTPARQGLLVGFGFFAGLGAVFASSCCVVPLSLAALGVGTGTISNLEFLTAWRIPFLVVSAVAIAGGWAMWRQQSEAACMPGSCSTPVRSRSALALLSLASIMVAVAAGWNYLEPVLLKTFIRG